MTNRQFQVVVLNKMGQDIKQLALWPLGLTRGDPDVVDGSAASSASVSDVRGRA